MSEAKVFAKLQLITSALIKRTGIALHTLSQGKGKLRTEHLFLGLLQQGLEPLGVTRRKDHYARDDERDNRTDHFFTWDRRGSQIDWRPDDPEAGVGSVRLVIGVQGGEVGRFNRFLRVPEEFERDQARMLSDGTVLAIAAFGLTALLSFVAIGIAIVRVRKSDLDWKPAISLGIIVSLLMLLFNALNWPI